MPVVTTPASGQSYPKTTKTFIWNMQGVYHTSSKAIVGSAPGAENYYPGSNPPKSVGTYTDGNVSHPGGNRQCYTRVKYQKGGTAFYTDGSTITPFTSTG